MGRRRLRVGDYSESLDERAAYREALEHVQERVRDGYECEYDIEFHRWVCMDEYGNITEIEVEEND
jgi:hypothetical protein